VNIVSVILCAWNETTLISSTIGQGITNYPWFNSYIQSWNSLVHQILTGQWRFRRTGMTKFFPSSPNRVFVFWSQAAGGEVARYVLEHTPYQQDPESIYWSRIDARRSGAMLTDVQCSGPQDLFVCHHVRDLNKGAHVLLDIYMMILIHQLHFFFSMSFLLAGFPPSWPGQASILQQQVPGDSPIWAAERFPTTSSVGWAWHQHFCECWWQLVRGY
jgi:hypothetical protein